MDTDGGSVTSAASLGSIGTLAQDPAANPKDPVTSISRTSTGTSLIVPVDDGTRSGYVAVTQTKLHAPYKLHPVSGDIDLSTPEAQASFMGAIKGDCVGATLAPKDRAWMQKVMAAFRDRFNKPLPAAAAPAAGGSNAAAGAGGQHRVVDTDH